jgi:peptidoglycan/xylan/chitin deacetylase (PgdA/CDA1 family)
MLWPRIRSILRRFGITSKRYRDKLDRYSTVTKKFDCFPTLPLTAVILKRHRRLMGGFSKKGIEFAIHGYIHTDYGSLPLQEQTAHFRKAIYTFRSCQIPFSGFRAPYLRTNEYLPEALSGFEFIYDSSQTISWDVVNKSECPEEGWSSYVGLLEFYHRRSAKEYLSLPRFTNSFVEIPVSIPDDEAIVERLGITAPGKIADIWGAILNMTYRRGELFTLQLHPERILLCEEALGNVLQQARNLNPPVWIATLSEIAQWWRERQKFTIDVIPEGNSRYRVKADCSDRATLLFKKCQVDAPLTQWMGGYQTIESKNFVITSPVRPVIGVNTDSSLSAVEFLTNEGYVVERSDKADGYGIFLDNLSDFKESGEKSLTEKIEQSDFPLLRYWRWPNKARSALSVTGDIDSVTLTDFVLRIFENLRPRS